MPDIAGAFTEAMKRCCDRLLDDPGHTENSPLVYGPCDTCANEVVKELAKKRT